MHIYLELSSLIIIVLYALMLFRNTEPLLATAICVILGFIINFSTPIQIGKTMADALGSFMALVGFIIMLGRGLGEVMIETKVSNNLVHKIVHVIGINTKTRVKIGVIVSSFVIVGVLGTLAGGLAILSPSLRPIAGKVGLSRPSLAVLMQASAEEALIMGPFTPPVVTILGITGLHYSSLLLFASLPIVLVTIITTWIMSDRLQKQYPNELCETNISNDTYAPTRIQNRATIVFIFGFLLCILYGLFFNAKTSYVIFVMIFLTFITGYSCGLSSPKIFKILISGMQKNLHLFFLFVLFDPFMSLIQSAGGFSAITKILTPLIHLGGKPVLSIIIGFTGAFGMPGASEATIKMLYQTFSPSVLSLNMTMTSFALCMLFATRVTNYIYPGPNMFASMGYAGSENIKAMIQNGLTVTLIQVIFLVIYSLCL